jgi:hypothetical protein
LTISWIMPSSGVKLAWIILEVFLPNNLASIQKQGSSLLFSSQRDAQRSFALLLQGFTAFTQRSIVLSHTARHVSRWGIPLAGTHSEISSRAGGYPQTPFLSFSSARRKELKEASTPSKASPYMGRMQLIPGRDRPPSKFWYGSPAFALKGACPLQGSPWSLTSPLTPPLLASRW